MVSKQAASIGAGKDHDGAVATKRLQQRRHASWWRLLARLDLRLVHPA